MKYEALSLQTGFEVAFAVRKVQAAGMTLAPGSNTGGPDNRHAGADQWLCVVSGTGLAIVDGARQPLQPGSLLVIERGEAHEIRCTAISRCAPSTSIHRLRIPTTGKRCRRATVDRLRAEEPARESRLRRRNESDARVRSPRSGHARTRRTKLGPANDDALLPCRPRPAIRTRGSIAGNRLRRGHHGRHGGRPVHGMGCGPGQCASAGRRLPRMR